MGRIEQFGTPRKIAELIDVAWRDEVVECRSLDDFDEFGDSGRRTNQDEAARFGSFCKLAPPTFDEGTD
jgi:hypothetical protein